MITAFIIGALFTHMPAPIQTPKRTSTEAIIVEIENKAEAPVVYLKK